ncbi:MAG: hypothetical protein V4695_08735 [Pseudomonadota bacterium]
MAQSRFWTNNDGYVTVTRADGSLFKTDPLNIGVESELYTRFLEDDSKDTTVEEWFAQTIDGPATKMINYLLDPANVIRKLGPRHRSYALMRLAAMAKEAGYRVHPYMEFISIPDEIRHAIADYVSALLVRHPTYLAKLKKFHVRLTASDKQAKNSALEDMLRMFEIYKEKIAHAPFVLSKTSGSAEYLYADGGLLVDEPWREDSRIPFDIHAPLTPELSLQVLPMPLQFADDLSTASIGEQTNQGVARSNRIILEGAKRFVFSRQEIPATFIKQNFGKPAPRNTSICIENGELKVSNRPHF